jgi:hypothetical protein
MEVADLWDVNCVIWKKYTDVSHSRVVSRFCTKMEMEALCSVESCRFVIGVTTHQDEKIKSSLT